MELANTGWTEEARAASLAVRRARAEERKSRREAERRRQGEIGRRDGTEWVSGWYAKGADGVKHDPHWGKTAKEAPYGYNEATGKAREEPLYDEYGAPIVPRQQAKWYQVRSLAQAAKEEAYARAREKVALKEWGRFGMRKKWFAKWPESTEEEWKAWERRDRRLREERKERETEQEEVEEEGER